MKPDFVKPDFDLAAGPDGARALDMFTFLDDPGSSEFFQVTDEANDPDQRLFEARAVR